MAAISSVTLGCRLNIVESEAMRDAARAAGLSGLTIINTCAVTAQAMRQSKQAIRRAKRDAPGHAIAVTGCAAEIDPDAFAAMPEVDALVGNARKSEAAAWQALRAVPAFARARKSADAPTAVATRGGHTRAFVQIQNGCDHRCTFCIIPFGRGDSRSREVGEIIAEICSLTDGGHAEIVLTGVDITSYAGAGGETVAALVRAILDRCDGVRRLRLSSIDCAEIDLDLLGEALRDPRFMPHLHLSLQSGDDMILKRMKRRHNRNDAIQFCAGLRKARPDLVFGADFIVGFPTETEAMFARTLGLVAECGLTHLHVFPFSPRPGTPAARMPQVAPALVKERAARLRAEGGARVNAHLRGQVGKRLTLLMERGGIGRAPDFSPVRVEGLAPGTFAEVDVTGLEGPQLLGRPASRIPTANPACAPEAALVP